MKDSLDEDFNALVLPLRLVDDCAMLGKHSTNVSALPDNLIARD